MKLQIKEAMSSTIPDWLRPILSKPKKGQHYDSARNIRDEVDIANTEWHPIDVPTSAAQLNRLLQDTSKYVFVRFYNDYGDPVVYSNYYQSNSQPKVGGKWRDIEKVPKKYMLDNLIDIGYLDTDKAGIRQKQIDRRKSREGALGLNRKQLSQYPEYKRIRTSDYYADENKIQGPRQQVWLTRDKYDKSGYLITGIEKYKDMLAQMGLSNYESILDQAYDAYEDFTKIFRLCRDNPSNIRAFRAISNEFLDIIKNLDYKYAQYQKEQDTVRKHPEMKDWESWYEKDVKKSLKQLRSSTRVLNDFAKIIQSGDGFLDDSTYENSVHNNELRRRLGISGLDF